MSALHIVSPCAAFAPQQTILREEKATSSLLISGLTASPNRRKITGRVLDSIDQSKIAWAIRNFAIGKRYVNWQHPYRKKSCLLLASRIRTLIKEETKQVLTSKQSWISHLLSNGVSLSCTCPKALSPFRKPLENINSAITTHSVTQVQRISPLTAMPPPQKKHTQFPHIPEIIKSPKYTSAVEIVLNSGYIF